MSKNGHERTFGSVRQMKTGVHSEFSMARGLPVLCAVSTGLFYYLVFFTDWGNFSHGGGPVDHAILSAMTVVVAYLCLKAARSRQAKWERVVAVVLGIPPALATITLLFSACRTIFGQ